MGIWMQSASPALCRFWRRWNGGAEPAHARSVADRAQRRDTLFEWRMRHEQALQAAAHVTADAEGRQLVRRQRLVVGGLQALERADSKSPTMTHRSAAFWKRIVEDARDG
jgi:hypothetical protein